ncbi:putative N-acetyltransferase YuaI [Alicyclobacillus hesperidum subsp. aegles]|uniref:GNAT family N-acetyltransferase n=1 Tax=Alicyclobacillus hesperidum TaxID=89784 RepID=UPI00222A7285|nr:GNAT family N-acetyltransferase [Alicyclobacillus hesperidum]GLG02286.1 putative N-acetyltransferase YuaI [Alicyclobacillus hesperidum subsp. aegles]
MPSQWLIRRVSDSDYGQIARVHVDSWRTTYKGIVPDNYLDELSYETSEARWRRVSAQNGPDYAMFVAEDGVGQIVGFANGGKERSGDTDYDGELYSIYLRESHQRQGLGQKLFHRIVQHLVSTDFHSMLIWVLADNPACHFYESLGGVPIIEQDVEIDGKSLREIGYGWGNLQATLDGLLKNTPSN